MSDNEVYSRVREMEIKQERMLTMLESIVDRNNKADTAFEKHMEDEEPYHVAVSDVVTKIKTFSAVAGFIFIIAQVVIIAYFTMIHSDISTNRAQSDANNDAIIEHVATDMQSQLYIRDRLKSIEKTLEKMNERYEK